MIVFGIQNRAALAAMGLALSCAATGAIAQAPANVTVNPPAPTPPVGLDVSDELLGSIGRMRPALDAIGVSATITDTTDTLGNVTGGIREATVVQGAGFASLAFDSTQSGLWAGGSALISAWGIYGRGLSQNALDNLHAITNLEADRSLRLFELWFQQNVIDDHVSLRVGQIAADQEFMIDPNAAVFINSHYGFAGLPSFDLPGGGPAYPFATPGVRLRVSEGSAALLIALVNADPAPPGPPGSDPQALNGSGTTFRTNAGALWFAEAQYTLLSIATMKFGGWYTPIRFADERNASNGLSLAAPESSGSPRMLNGNFSLYGLSDFLIWRPNDNVTGLTGFVRIQGAPSDRNFIDYSADGGLSWQGILSARPLDTAGIGVEWGHVSTGASKLDSDTSRYTDRMIPVRRWEVATELTYQAQIRTWLQLQPDLQIVIRPGGGIPMPQKPTAKVGDELVLGVRSIVTF